LAQQRKGILFMDRVRSTNGRHQAPGFIIPVLLLGAVLLFTGCAPKKVIKTNPAAPKIVTVDSEPKVDFLMPTPRLKGKSGQAPSESFQGQNQSSKYAQEKSSSENSSAMGLKAAALARKQLGKQYKWGAVGPDRFDCSGLTLFVYQKVGLQLPRNSRSQAKVGKEVTRKDLQPGDLLFFAISGKTINHVGIYVGGNKFIHAPRKYNPVRTDSLNNSWWRQRLKVARRLG